MFFYINSYVLVCKKKERRYDVRFEKIVRVVVWGIIFSREWIREVGVYRGFEVFRGL